jgi:ribonuclease P protein component
MKKENRLKKRKQFNWTFKNGQKVYSPNLVLVYTTSRAKNYKIGFSVTKKVGKAVTRNHTKRLMREAVRKFENNIAPKHTLVFVAKPEIVNENLIAITEEVELLLKKSKLFVKYEQDN